MSDRKQARAILLMAKKDLKALKGMLDGDVFDDEIFGFHAQQSLEKALKAWIALLGLEYPLTHDISGLLGFLERSGADVKCYWGLVQYNAFAVRFRYELLEPPDELLDRASAINEAEQLIAHVDGLLQDMDSAP